MPEKQGFLATKILLIVLSVLLPVVLFGAGLFGTWLYFQKSAPGSKTAAKEASKAVTYKTVWDKEVSFPGKIDTAAKIYGVYVPSRNDYLIFASTKNNYQFQAIDFNTGQKSKREYLPVTCNGGDYRYQTEYGALVCRAEAKRGEAPDAKLPKGNQVSLKLDASGTKVKVERKASPEASKEKYEAKPPADADAIKKFDFGNTQWTAIRQPEKYVFVNGKYQAGGCEYQKDMTIYGYLNDDDYLDAYTKAICSADPGSDALTSYVIEGWVWDPQAKTAKAVPMSDMFSPYHGAPERSIAVSAARDFVISKDNHFYAYTFFGNDRHEIVLINGYPVFKDRMTVMLWPFEEPNMEQPIPVDNMDIRTIPEENGPQPVRVKDIDLLTDGRGVNWEENGYITRFAHFRGDPGEQYPVIVWVKKN